MLVDIRPTGRLRGSKPVDVTACLAPIVQALCRDSVDLSRVRLALDWVQYKSSFREVLQAHRILAPEAEVGNPSMQVDGHRLELAVDLRRCGEVALGELTGQALAGCADDAHVPGVLLEDWRRTTTSCIWDFNALYWRALDLWEQATGRKYEQALPGGESDARNTAAVRELIGELFELWDGLAERNSLPDELFVVELGVGNGNQARTWLDTFRAMDREHGRDYYQRLQYLMCDYSPHVLEQARKNVAEHEKHISSFAMDATNPTTALGFLRYKVFLVYISNVYDNLPNEEVARLGGRTYRVETRAYLPQEEAKRIAESIGVDVERLPQMVHKLLRLGPQLLADAFSDNVSTVDEAVKFWQATWLAVRLDERYVPLSDVDAYEIAPGVSGTALHTLLEADGDIRMHINNGAVASFVETLPLLQPYGLIKCHDLFVTDAHAYHTGFRGPGKYDGSVVNWVNGPLLQLIASRRGFDVHYAPFAHRTGTNIVTMTAQVRD